LTDEEKILIIQKLSAKITREGFVDDHLSGKAVQLENKGDAGSKIKSAVCKCIYSPQEKKGY